jgi:hypothetical protein
MVAPAGLDRFFENVRRMNRGLSKPDIPRVKQLMESYGMELVGPPFE